MLFIFDWDGTLSDSTEKIVSAMAGALKDAGAPKLAADVIQNIIGLGLPEAIAELLPDSDSLLKEKVRQRYVDRFVSMDHVPTPFFPTVEETLHTLRDRGYQLAVATGKSRRGLNRALTNHDMKGFFHGTRCADETRSKPHPLMLNELLAEFDLNASEAVMIGDTEFDMAMAEAIDMPRVAVDYGAHHPDRLTGYQPVLCISEMSELVTWIEDHR